MKSIKTLDGQTITNLAVYGNERTKLKLTGRAFEIYSDTDPLTIYEKDWGEPHEVYSGGGMMKYENPTYFVRGAFEVDDITEADLIEMILEFGEDYE